MRSKLVPIVNISSRFSQWMVIGGIILGAGAGQPGIGQMVAIGGFSFYGNGYTYLALLPLPVEYDASNRASSLVRKQAHMVTREELSRI